MLVFVIRYFKIYLSKLYLSISDSLKYKNIEQWDPQRRLCNPGEREREKERGRGGERRERIRGGGKRARVLLCLE